MANRYDTGSISNFQPLSFQELSIAPMMMRQKHDASIAQAEALRVQATPLDIHLNRATELKNQMDNEIAKNVDTLNKEGYNPTTFQNIQKLNRQYNDLVSPTGEIGKINQAAAVQNENYKQWMASDEAKKYGTQVANARWSQHVGDYNNDFKNNGVVTNIQPMEAPKYQDLDEDLKNIKLGKNQVTSMINNGYHVVHNPDGSLSTTTGTGQVLTTTNDEQQKAAILNFGSKWLSPNGEGYKSAQFAGMSPENIRDRILSAVGMKSEYGNINTMHDTHDIIGYKNDGQKQGNLGFDKIPQGASNTSGSTDLSDKINSIGTNSIKSALNYSANVFSGKIPQAQTKEEFDNARKNARIQPKDVLNPTELSIYNNAKLDISKNTPGFDKMSKEDQNKLIAKKATNDIATFSPVILKPTSKSIGALIPSVQKDSDLNSIGNSMYNDAVSGNRVLYDVETGDPISKDDISKKGTSLSLYGIGSPHNLGNQKMNGATYDQKISPIYGIMTDGDGKKSQVYIGRTGSELNSPNFKQVKSAHNVFNGILNHVNENVLIQDKNSKLYNSRVRYNSNITDGKPIILTKPGQQPERISLDEFENDSFIK